MVMLIYSVSENACLVPYQYVCVLLALNLYVTKELISVVDRVL